MIIELKLMDQGIETAVVKALKVGEVFAVFEKHIGWNVTHVATGCSVTDSACCVFHAVAIIEAIEPAMDWSGTPEEISARGRPHIGKLVTTAKCPREWCDGR